MKIESNTMQSRLIQRPLVHLAFKDRIQRSAKSFFLGIGLALCALPIPGLHLVLVPTFLSFALYSGYSKFRQTKSIDLSGETCPVCQKVLKEKVIYSHSEILRLDCLECRSQLRLIND